MRLCTVAGCTNKHLSKGLCTSHYHLQHNTYRLEECLDCGPKTSKRWYNADGGRVCVACYALRARGGRKSKTPRLVGPCSNPTGNPDCKGAQSSRWTKYENSTLCRNCYGKVYRSKTGKETLRERGRDCYAKKPEQYRGAKYKWRKENPERAQSIKRQSYIKHRVERVAAASQRTRKWRINNPELHRSARAHEASMRRNKLHRTSLSSEMRAQLYELQCRKPPRVTLDHIIAMKCNPDLACGLTVPWNMQELTPAENLFKLSSFDGTYENNGWRQKFRYPFVFRDCTFEVGGALVIVPPFPAGDATCGKKDYRLRDEVHYLRRAAGKPVLVFWPDEWNNKGEICLSIANSKMQKHTRVFARKCTVTTDFQRLQDFIEQNHLQGSAPSIEAWGLLYGGEVVLAASVGRHHRQGHSSLVLNRVAGKIGCTVVGGLSRLIPMVPRPLITWSHNRLSKGESYEKMGFKFDCQLDVDYEYARNGERYSKTSLRLRDQETGERGLRLAQGYVRIWDCGKTRWRLE